MNQNKGISGVLLGISNLCPNLLCFMIK